MKNNTQKRRGLLWKIPLGLVLILLVVGAILILNIDSIARSQINKALDRYLTAGGNLESIDIQLLQARITLAGLTINSPPGSGPDPLLDLGELEVDVAPQALLSGKVLVEYVTVKGLSLNIVRDKKGRLSLLELAPAASTKNDPETVEDDEESGPPWIPSIHVDSIQVTDLSLLLNDRLMDEQWSAGLNLELAVAGLKLEDIAAFDVLVDQVNLTVSQIALDQLPGFSQKPLLAVGKIQIASDSIDLSASKLPVSRISLDTLSASLERNPNGDVNLLKLVDSWMPLVEELTAKDQNQETEARGQKSEVRRQKPASSIQHPVSSTQTPLPTVTIDDIQLKSITAQVLDSIDGQPWRAGFDDLGIQIKDVEVGDLAKLAISLASFDLNLKDIAVDQMPGFSQSPLLAIDNIELASNGIDLSTSKVSVSRVSLDTLSASLERNPNGDVNLLKLVDAWMPLVEELATKDRNQETEVRRQKPEDRSQHPVSSIQYPASSIQHPVSSTQAPFPTVTIEDIQLKSITAQVLDTIDGQPWRAGFDNLGIQIKDVEVGDPAEQAVSLESFDMNLSGIAVDQVPGFGDQKLFSLDRFAVISEEPDLSSKELVIKKVLLQGLTSSITMRSDGLTNIQKLKEALLRDKDTPPQENVEATDAPQASDTAAALPAVRFEHILLEDGSATYRDEVFAKKPLVAELNDIRVEAKQLRLFSEDTNADPAHVSASFELEQPGELPTAYFGTLSQVGPVTTDIPMVNTHFRLVGLKLDSLGSLVPKATRTALGASGLDAALALAMDADSINLNASVLTDHNIQYEGITVQGSLDAPVVKIGPVLTGVFNRVSDGLVNIGKSGLKSGVHIAEGGVGAAKELGTGALKVGKKLGKSLFETTAGVVTLDKGKVKEGVSESTRGTVDLTKDSIKGTGQAAGGGLKNSASELKGGERVKAWENDIPTRYQKAMQQAGDALVKMPYPPVTR